MRKKVLVSWSTGKDSAWALHILQQDPDIEVAGLFCTVTETFQRVNMHGVRIKLLEEQASSANLPLHIVHIPSSCTDDLYKKIIKDFAGHIRQENNIECFAFGDLFLEEVRRYREELLFETGIIPLFPIWGIPTHELANRMISSGLKARIVCLDPKQLPRKFAGKEFDASFLNEKPAHVDSCAENGEFHTFAFDGPMFNEPIRVEVGKTVMRDSYCFTDLLPISGNG
ncbi:MAG: hypothetical protein WCK42_00905 [Myxococcaceae bacterium]